MRREKKKVTRQYIPGFLSLQTESLIRCSSVIFYYSEPKQQQKVPDLCEKITKHLKWEGSWAKSLFQNSHEAGAGGEGL